jgi:hypothetical protein
LNFCPLWAEPSVGVDAEQIDEGAMFKTVETDELQPPAAKANS